MWVTAEFHCERGSCCRDYSDRGHTDDDIQRPVANPGCEGLEARETLRRGLGVDTGKLVPEPAV
jgi:hypothetical protein